MKVLIDENYRKLLVKDNLDKDLELDIGVFSKDQLNAAKNGEVLQSHLHKKAFILDAGFADKMEGIQRGPQVIVLKDAALIGAYTGIGNGSLVVDAGAGSGALISYLGKLVQPSGKIVSYEVNEEFLKIAHDNIRMMGLENNVVIKKGSVYDGIEEKNIDMLCLDLPEPWKAIPQANQSLKIGGFFVTYLPTITQVIAFVSQLGKNYRVEQVFEALQRNWKVIGQAVRPENLMLGHTGFITIARRLY